MLLSSDEINHDKQKQKQNEFYQNKTNFFNSKNNIKINKYNKTDIKFPAIKIKTSSKKKIVNNNQLYKTVNNKKKVILKPEENITFNRIFNKFKMFDKKYNDLTRYFKFYIKSGNNNSKMNINKKINNFKHISSITKHKTTKYCFNAFQRIKSIQ